MLFRSADDDRRRRGFGEVPKMLEQSLLAAGVTSDRIQIIPSEVEAIEYALSISEADDLVIVLGDNITRCWKQIVHFGDDGQKRNVNEKPSSDYAEILFEPVEHAFHLEEGQRLVKDERGVRIVIEHDEEAD